MYVIYNDTDACYVELERVVNLFNKNGDKTTEDIVSMLDSFCAKRVEPIIEQSYDEMFEYTNSFEQTMVMTREIISSCMVMRGKKMYAAAVYDNEGVRYAKPKIKKMGLETARSSTPQICRDALSEAIEVLLLHDNEKLIKVVEDFRTIFFETPIEALASPRGCNGIEKWQDQHSKMPKKGCPKHVRAAINYNNMLIRFNMDNKPISSGDKIKFIDLKMPNKYMYPVIGFPVSDMLPKEFDLHDKINYDVMWETTFIKPIKSLLDVCGWDIEESNSLEDLFG